MFIFMKKGSLRDIFSLLVVVGLVSLSGYLILDGSSKQISAPPVVKETSSYKSLQEYDSLNKMMFNITEEDIVYSRKNDFPYNFSEAPKIEESTRFFAVIVEFGEFKETESRLFVANNGVDGYVYQLKDGKIISEGEAFGPVGKFNRAYNNLTMCKNSSIHIESIKVEEYSTNVKISNPGSSEFNGNYAGDINLTFTSKDGAKTTKSVSTLFFPDSKKLYDLNFDSINGEKLEKIKMDTIACPAQSQTVTDLPTE